MSVSEKEVLAQRILNCEKIRHELVYSFGWISKETIDARWVANLEFDDAKKERVSAFCARFGRLQDYFSDRLLKAWVEAVGDIPGTALQNYSIAERAGILTVKSEDMPGLRKLRNDLTHEYITDASDFAGSLSDAINVSRNYFDMLDNMKLYCKDRLGIDTGVN